MKSPSSLILMAVLSAMLMTCEREFTPDIPTRPPEYVVEGFIEAGDQALPPYVLLTRSVPFFQELDADQLTNLFVHDADVRVFDGQQEVSLREICLDQLPESERERIAEWLGFESDSLQVDFCAYIDLSGNMQGVEGETYLLTIEAGGVRLEAETTIPFRVPLDSLRFKEPPGEPSDTLAQLRAWISDPGGPNQYRYQTRINDGAFQAGVNSVVEDRLFDGQEFEFPLPKAEPPGTDFDPETFGLYRRGDTVTIKWISIDKAHFDFWNTLEFNAANQGPFSSYTRISSNIVGGLGIWGGMSSYYYERVVPEE